MELEHLESQYEFILDQIERLKFAIKLAHTGE
jgi:hypothetical protein